MNDLYIHQLETENKQLRIALKSTNEVVKEYLEKEKYCDELEEKIDKIRKHCKKEYFIDESGKPVIDKADKLLEILGDKENE